MDTVDATSGFFCSDLPRRGLSDECSPFFLLRWHQVPLRGSGGDSCMRNSARAARDADGAAASVCSGVMLKRRSRKALAVPKTGTCAA